MVTDEEGNAAFKVKFNTDITKDNKSTVTFTANRRETSVTNDD